jgi:hypothetical protein
LEANTLSLINSKALDTAGSYYLKALEEVGKIKILQAGRGDEIGTSVEITDDVHQKARDSRIQAALDHLGREWELCGLLGILNTSILLYSLYKRMIRIQGSYIR